MIVDFQKKIWGKSNNIAKFLDMNFLTKSSNYVLIFHCLRINYKEVRYLADPKIPYLNSLGKDLIYHLGFFINWYANFLIFPFDWYFLSCQYWCFCWPIWILDAASFVYIQYVLRDSGTWYTVPQKVPPKLRTNNYTHTLIYCISAC